MILLCDLMANERPMTAHDGADRQTDRQTDKKTWRLLDQLGPEGRVGENQLYNE